MITEIYPHLFLLRRDEGNVLFKTTASVQEDLVALDALGGVQHLLLGDRHHALPATAKLAKRFGTVLSASTIEAKVLGTNGVEIGRQFATYARKGFPWSCAGGLEVAYSTSWRKQRRNLCGNDLSRG